MGYIRLDIMREDKIEKFVFIHGAFIDTKWSAKLIDKSNDIIQTFEGDGMGQCLKKFAKFLQNFGTVIDMAGEQSEKNSIEMVYDSLQQLS